MNKKDKQYLEAIAVSETTITVRDNGPLRVAGPIKLLDAEGNVFEHKESFSLCRCGQSSNKPFCDGTHAKIGFENTSRAK